MGETPHRLAKEASLLNLWGLSLPGKETNSGLTCATNWSSCASSSAISLERAS
jgi:hypothetical protein